MNAKANMARKRSDLTKNKKVSCAEHGDIMDIWELAQCDNIKEEPIRERSYLGLYIYMGVLILAFIAGAIIF